MNAEPRSRQPRGWLVLARGSYLPTVWSNCLAGAWLGGYLPGGERPVRLALLLIGASALYTAGTFLDGVFDRPFDAPDHPARLFPAGPVDRRAAGRAGAGLLMGGVFILGLLGWMPLVLALALAGSVVLCAWLHERTTAGAALMGGCRFFLYPLATAASQAPALPAAALEGLLLASYVFGLSVLARDEALTDHAPPRWPWLLIALPIAINAALAGRMQAWRVVVVALPVFWLLRIALGRVAPLGVGRGAALLAGIVLFDLSAVAACAPYLPWLGWFAILFVLALAFQGFVPANLRRV